MKHPYLTAAATVIFLISFGLNVWFITGKGITINQDRRMITYNSQWQGQILINQWETKGDKIVWRTVKCGRKIDNVPKELGKLHPVSSLYAKVIFCHYLGNDGKWFIIYPDIFSQRSGVWRSY